MVKTATPFVKDGIGDFVVNDNRSAVNPAQAGTKAAAHYIFDIAPQASETIYLRLVKKDLNRRDAKAQKDTNEPEEELQANESEKKLRVFAFQR